jgi:competence protein ComEC
LSDFRKEKGNPTWKTAPFLRLLIPLVAGIVLEKYLPIQVAFQVPVFCFSALLIALFNLFSFPGFFKMDWITGTLIQIAILSFGRLVMHIHQDIPIEHSARFSKNRPNLLLIRLLSEPVPRLKTWKSVARITNLLSDSVCFVEDEKILVYFDKKPDAHQISVGSTLLIQKELLPIQNFKSIDFDYRSYCHLHHIYAQIFLRSHEFVLIGSKQENLIISYLDRLRKKLLTIIRNQLPRKSQGGFLEALLFGYTEDLDPEILKSYADTGVIHIIAISGLHLALICQLLQKVLMGPGSRKFVRWSKFSVLIISLWGYSIFSGSSPSVIRAAAMFSMVLLGRNLLREAVLYNTLAASAFLLLCFDPNWLWDTGFQLSYAAILGLRLFAAPLEALVQLENKLLAGIWKAASVSIAAQVLTTPISIFFFHQFPVYFLFANLLAVPTSSLILLGGILLCIFCWIQPVAWLLGWLLDLGIQFLNGVIRYISELPGSVISPLTLTIQEVICLYFIICCLYWFLIQKQKSWFFAALSAIALSQLIRLF